MDINLLDKNIVTTILNEITSSEERDRKRQAFDAFQVYSGNLKPYVQAELKRTRPSSWEAYSVSNVSISKMVVDKLARSYSVPPMRSVDNETKNERLEEIYDEAMANRQWNEFDVNFNRDRHSLFWVNWRNKEERYQFMSLASYEWSVIKNKDTSDLECVILNYPDTTVTANARGYSNVNGDGKSNLLSESQVDGGGQSRVYAMWTHTQHVVIRVQEETIRNADGTLTVKKDITYVPIEGNPNNENVLGIIPFVYISRDLSPDNPTVNPITDQTVTFNALWSELLTAANIQGTSIMSLSYDASLQGKMDTMQGSLTSVIELIQPSDPDAKPTEASYISPSPDLAGQRDSYINYLRMVLSEHGITSSQGLDGSMEKFSSGIERMIAQADVQMKINSNQMLYAKAEKDAFEIVKRIERIILNSSAFGDEDELNVVYPKPKVMISDRETLENIKMRMDMGLIEEWEALVVLDPNLSEEQAKDKLERINEAKQTKMEGFLGANIETESDEDAESE